MSAAPTLNPTTPPGAAMHGPRSAGLRILVLDEAIPYPPDSGKRLRTWHLLRRLARTHEVTLLCYADAAERSGRAALAAAGIEVHTVHAPSSCQGWRLYAGLLANCFSRWPYSVAKHHSRRFRDAIDELCARRAFDLIQVEWTPYASHLRPGHGKYLIATHNIEAQIWRRRAALTANPAARLFFGIQAAKMRRFEINAFRRAAAVTAVSVPDYREAVAMGARRVSVVANGVDLEYFRPLDVAIVPGRLVFVGALDWFPNQDGVTFFAERLLPALRVRCPLAHLHVVGRRPSAELGRRLAACAGVTLVGEVDDVRPELAAAAAAVVPLRVGGGSRIKIVEAMAMAKAVVATTIGAEGLEAEPGTHLLIADSDAALIGECARLLEAPALARQFGHASLGWVREHHSWDDCARALDAALRGAGGAQ